MVMTYSSQFSVSLCYSAYYSSFHSELRTGGKENQPVQIYLKKQSLEKLYFRIQHLDSFTAVHTVAMLAGRDSRNSSPRNNICKLC